MLEQAPNLSDAKIRREVESFFLGLNYAAILGMLYKISFSLGSAKGREIYIKVTKKIDTPALHLIQIIIELQFEKGLDLKKIEKLHLKFSKNSRNRVCNRLLKHIIIRYYYMHDIDFRTRQQLSDKLNIPLQEHLLSALLKQLKNS